MTNVTRLDTFRRQATLKAETPKDERVWNRVERTQSILTAGGFINDQLRHNAWNNAAEALLQYMDNEWPIENKNACRADDIAEYAAILFVMGTFDQQLTDKALKVQETALQGFEYTKLMNAEHRYRNSVGKLMDAIFSTHVAAPVNL